MMRVSIALHLAEPSLAGNQRDAECKYMNYNRQYAELDGDGNCVIDAAFPASGESFPDWVAHFFSIGVCESVPQDTGGKIINYAPLYEPLPVTMGMVPKIKCVMHVTPKRMTELELK